MNTSDSYTSIIDLWPSYKVLADDIGEKYGTVKQWANRNSIHSKYWKQIVDAAELRGIKGVTYETLVKIASKQAPL